MPLTTKLLKTIGLLYKMQPADQRLVEADLMERRKAEWLTAMRELAQQHGCNLTPQPPRLNDLQELKAMSAEDAQSIVNTWNRDVERQIERLFNANRRGNRNYYYKNMEAWAEGRRSWKQPQIAITTAQQTRWVAQTRFRQMNGLRGQQYVFYGPPPVCAICIGLFAEGLVSEAFIQQNPTPVHPLCPHEWRPVAIQRISCDDIWVG